MHESTFFHNSDFKVTHLAEGPIFNSSELFSLLLLYLPHSSDSSDPSPQSSSWSHTNCFGMQMLLWHVKAFSSQVLLGAKENKVHKTQMKLERIRQTNFLTEE